MLHEYFETRVPERFQAVLSVNNRLTREHLTRMVCDIDAAARELSDIEIEPGDKNLFNRYMSYLEKSCSYRHTINTRSGWLLTYGNIVLHKLNSYRFSTAPSEEPEDTTLRGEFTARFTDTITKLSWLAWNAGRDSPNYLTLINQVAEGILDILKQGGKPLTTVQTQTMFAQLEILDLRIMRALDLGTKVTEESVCEIYTDIQRLAQVVRFLRMRAGKMH